MDAYGMTVVKVHGGSCGREREGGANGECLLVIIAGITKLSKKEVVHLLIS